MKLNAWFLPLALIAFSACSKKNTSTSGPLPTITSISPNTGHYGTILTIIGANFNPVATQNVVLIDSVPATPLQASADSLIVLVPTAHTGTVVVKTDAGSVTGPTFIYQPDILIAGTKTDFTNGAAYSAAQYWDNGVAIPLTDGQSSAQAHCIASSGNDIYVGGYEFVGANQIATIWKNTVATDISGSMPSLSGTDRPQHHWIIDWAIFG